MSSGTVSSSHLFEDLWKQLKECHQNALLELEVKVVKLKKDRFLDAQKLEVFYNRNQLLKEENSTLQDAISHLEEKLRTGECKKCALLKENHKNSQDQSLQIISKLESERNALEDKNRQLFTELQKMKTQCSDSSSEQEDGVIPDSPVLTSSLTAGSRLRKNKNTDKKRKKNIRYVEKPLPWSNRSLFSEPVCSSTQRGQAEVLVVNTCEEDAPFIPTVDDDVEGLITETCAFDLPAKHPAKVETTTSQQNKHDSRLSPDSTVLTASRLAASKRSLQFGDHTAKLKKQERNAEQIQGVVDALKEDKHALIDLLSRSTVFRSNRSFKKETLDDEVEPGPPVISSQNPPAACVSPAFKKPKAKFKREAEKRNPSALNHDMRPPVEPPVEPAWSVDPALALSMEDSERHEEEELTDTDRTWVSHSMLQGRGESSQASGNGPSSEGLGQKANDSLDMMFDRTVDGEYKSFIGESQPCDDDDDDDEEEEEDEEMEEEKHEADPPEKSQTLSFPHIAVVRKKDERRKLKGTTCKECEIYYSHLPEDQKQKKLAACSRHRFRYIPPCTPENFWEVGFPSTQTCIERGYIREEKKPGERLRRRRPFSALFSPKSSQKHS